MSAWFSRLSPSGRRVASGETVIHVDNRSTGFPGTSPQWFDEDTLLYTRQPDGALMRLKLGGEPVPYGAAYNEFHTQNGYVVGWPAGHNLRGPTVSASGVMAGIRDTGGAGVLVVGGRDMVDSGFLFDARFTGAALVWSKVEDGRRHTYGRRSIGAATELLSVDTTRDEFWPIAIETPVGLFVLNHGHEGCFVRAWGATGLTWSYLGITDYPDARWNGSAIRIVASERGQARDFLADPAGPANAPYPATTSAPPPVTPPPPPPPPEPPPETMTMQMPDAVFDTIEAVYNKFGLPEGEGAQRALQEKVCQTVRARHGSQWGWKRASGEPSTDAVAWRAATGPGAEFFVWDCVRDAGGPGREFSLSREAEGELVRGQTFIVVDAIDHLGDSAPPPPPPPPPTGGEASGRDYTAYLDEVESLQRASVLALGQMQATLDRIAMWIERGGAPAPSDMQPVIAELQKLNATASELKDAALNGRLSVRVRFS